MRRLFLAHRRKSTKMIGRLPDFQHLLATEAKVDQDYDGWELKWSHSITWTKTERSTGLDERPRTVKIFHSNHRCQCLASVTVDNDDCPSSSNHCFHIYQHAHSQQLICRITCAFICWTNFRRHNHLSMSTANQSIPPRMSFISNSSQRL